MAGRRNAGFTLVEVLVVMAIISVLMGFGIGMYQSLASLGKAGQARNTILETIKSVQASSMTRNAALVVDPVNTRVYGLEFVTVASCNFEPADDPDAEAAGTVIGLGYKSGAVLGEHELSPFPYGHTGGAIGFRSAGIVNFGNYADYDLVEGVTLRIWIFPTQNVGMDLIRKGESYGLSLKRGPGGPLVEGFLKLGSLDEPGGGSVERFTVADHPLLLNRWNGIVMKYDRNLITVAIDSFGRGAVERFRKAGETRPILPDPDADLTVGGSRGGVIGRVDDMMVAGIIAGDVRQMPGEVGIEGTEVRTIYFREGKLDPEYHQSPETIVLLYEGMPTPLTIGLLGNIIEK